MMQDTDINPTSPATAGTSDIVLELKGVSKQFGSVHAVEDVSFQVRRGEVFTLLGPTGSGLTTTLRLAIGLARLTHGEIISGRNSVDSEATKTFVPPDKRNMGMVFRSYAIWPHMTVAENVAYPLKVRRVTGPEIREQVAKVLEQVGLGGMEQRSPTMLSAADLQRVAVARSLVFEPDLLLLDEPFSNVDANLRDMMRADFRVLQQRLGITVLLATHDPIEALSVSDRVAVMNEGSIEQVGTPMQLYREPSSAGVRDLLGRTVILEGTVAKTGVPGSLGVRLHDSSGPVVHAQVFGDQAVADGSDCLLAVRPESVAVEPLDSVGDPDAPNTVRGVISTLLFVGDRFEARIELPWGDDVSLYLPPDDRWREGLPVAMRLAPHDLQVWPVATEEVSADEAASPAPSEEPVAAVDEDGPDQISE